MAWFLDRFNVHVSNGNMHISTGGGIDDCQLGAAIEAIHPAIWMEIDGRIIKANAPYLNLFRNTAEEVVGKHHSIFLSKEDARSETYHELWEKLAKGHVCHEVYNRTTKDGQSVWIEASYIPLITGGVATRVVEISRDVTERQIRIRNAETNFAAIHTTQAVIEFDTSGTVLTANENFLQITGYDLPEIRGRHHSMFLDANQTGSTEYEAFWEHLSKGEFLSGEYARVAKGGRRIWLQASYTPILGPDGTPCRIVKFASDVTDRVIALQSMSAGIKALNDGDLAARIPDTVGGKWTGLRDDFNTMTSRLGDVVAAIRDSADRMAEETDVIASSVQNLSSRNEQQAARVEETSAAMTEMESAVQSNADNTKAASDRAAEASNAAKNGSLVVGQAITSMQEIQESAKNIRRVNEVIDSIAFQTNLLALNAGVEAARAGDAGRGFAVVASEVRALAQRAAEAARDINDLVQKSYDAVSQGSELVTQSGAALDEIVGTVSWFVDNMSDISNATSEQAQGISSVRQAISDIDITTQRTAAIAEESAAAAKQLADRPAELRNLVSVFGASGTRQPDRTPKNLAQTTEENVTFLHPREAAAQASGGWTDF